MKANNRKNQEKAMDLEQTKRVISVDLENILYEQFNVLDSGFIRVIDYMGNDSSIAQAARVSYGKGTKTISDDTGLIRYLLRYKHTTPFEMCEIKFHIKAPIFVARQWLRHRTANVNEYSARYSILDESYYLPDHEQIKVQSVSNKQGRGESFSKKTTNEIVNNLNIASKEAVKLYQELLTIADSESNKQGLAKELARIILPVNMYTQFYWKIDLHNLLHFLMLRADSHAQYEIRVYAEKMLELVAKWVPITYQAFLDYTVNSHTFSAKEMAVLHKIINNEKVDYEASGLSKREVSTFKKSLKIT
ncbi:Thymidylate synthase ThyX [Candidatus Hepatincola sp. Pdp]